MHSSNILHSVSSPVFYIHTGSEFHSKRFLVESPFSSFYAFHIFVNYLIYLVSKGKRKKLLPNTLLAGSLSKMELHCKVNIRGSVVICTAFLKCNIIYECYYKNLHHLTAGICLCTATS